MNDGNSIQTSFWVMVFVQTIGSVDAPGNGERKMPSPRQYVAIVITWLILGFVASVGRNAARAASAMGWAFVLVGAVVGPFGQRMVSFMRSVASDFGTSPAAEAAFTFSQAAGVPPGTPVSALTPQPPVPLPRRRATR